MRAKLVILLHYHLPYVRKRGVWPYGEEWIYEALLGCYLPLLNVFDEVKKLGIKSAITCSLTPILSEQLNDPHIKSSFDNYLTKCQETTKLDIRDFELRGWNELAILASDWLSHLEKIESLWHSIGGDFIGAMKKLECDGVIEIGTSSATHGILPLLDTPSIRRQLSVGLTSAQRNFGSKPFSFWLPECAYKPGLEKYLEEAQIGCVFLDSAAITGHFESPGTSFIKTESVSKDLDLKGTTFQPYFLGQSNVSFMARNFDLSKQVWSAKEGYPGDYRYREFHKRYERSGNRYWRVTGGEVDLGDKSIYKPQEAIEIAKEHASHFIYRVKGSVKDAPGDLVFLSFDAELYGHWWHEGTIWLKEVLLKANDDPDIELSTPKKYLSNESAKVAARPPKCTWGDGSDLRTWLHPETQWMWNEIATMSSAFYEIKSKIPSPRLLSQLERELLLAQSSDWEFLVTTRQARAYGEDRFRIHMKAFWDLHQMIEKGINPDAFAFLSDVDNPFSFLEV